MSGFVLKNSTIKHVSQLKSLVGFLQLTIQITFDRRHVLYSLSSGLLLLVGRGGCPHVVLLLWVLAHVQTLSYAGGCVVSSHTQQSFAKLGLCDLARPLLLFYLVLHAIASLTLFPTGLSLYLLNTVNFNLKALVQTVTNLVYCKSRTLFNTIQPPGLHLPTGLDAYVANCSFEIKLF